MNKLGTSLVDLGIQLGLLVFQEDDRSEEAMSYVKRAGGKSSRETKYLLMKLYELQGHESKSLFFHEASH